MLFSHIAVGGIPVIHLVIKMVRGAVTVKGAGGAHQTVQPVISIITGSGAGIGPVSVKGG